MTFHAANNGVYAMLCILTESLFVKLTFDWIYDLPNGFFTEFMICQMTFITEFIIRWMLFLPKNL